MSAQGRSTDLCGAVTGSKGYCAVNGLDYNLRGETHYLSPQPLQSAQREGALI